MRTARTTLRNHVLGAAAVAALLSTAACSPDAGAEGAGTAPSSTASASTGGGASATPTATPSGGTGSAAPSSATPSSATPTTSPGKGGDAEGDVGGDGVPGPPCTDDSFTITASTSPHDSLQHILLTATNTSDKACVLGGHPAAVFEDAHHQASVMKSQLEEFLVQPGKKAYAGVRLFRTGAPTTAVKKMGVSLSPEGYEQNVPLPGGMGFVNIDNDPKVTYWTGSEGLAVKQSLAE
ncbi:DUF4232 domain-containing protein [Streptomyces sp. SKN60]|uniref:DUF4232 domain-containing protein n=1 Tax=Streptomyces sp. SKN60 TaxID=2855506 RepID=UPI002246FF1D|nr:DUF4232 domain-containing protein [Streptomyces sp. SKN60]MCX2182735.1 DUF4232 domain-containing protein [Streptomyces sp. SKN60]